MSNRQFQNFCEYQLRGSQNRCFALPNFSFGKTTLNNNIKRNNTQPSYKEDSKLTGEKENDSS